MTQVDANQYKSVITPALERAGGTHTWDDILRGLNEYRFQLWAGERAAAITEIVDYPRKRVLNVFLAGGDKGELLEMLEPARAFGRANGCVAITMSGRQGWTRVLNKHGWKPAFVVMSEDL